MTKQEQFFYDNAGGCYDPATETWEEGRTRSAVRLAQAETWAVQEGLRYCWWPDPDGCCMDDCDHADCEYCELVHPDGIVRESLSGICGATPDYRRVVQAELALEAMGRQEAAFPADCEACGNLENLCTCEAQEPARRITDAQVLRLHQILEDVTGFMECNCGGVIGPDGAYDSTCQGDCTYTEAVAMLKELDTLPEAK